MDKLQWNFNQNSNILIEENTFEDVVCEMSAILSRPQCVKHNKANRPQDIKSGMVQSSLITIMLCVQDFAGEADGLY